MNGTSEGGRVPRAEEAGPRDGPRGGSLCVLSWNCLNDLGKEPVISWLGCARAPGLPAATFYLCSAWYVLFDHTIQKK